MKNNIYGFMVDFTVPIRPVGKGRPRFTRNGHPYAPVDTKNAIRINVREVQRPSVEQEKSYKASAAPSDVCLHVALPLSR